MKIANYLLIIVDPCTYGRRIVWRDPWYGPAYEVSGPAGDPC